MARDLRQNQSLSPPQDILENAGPHGLSISGTTTGTALYVTPSVLAETTGSIPFMASWTLMFQGRPGLCNSSGPLEKLSVDGVWRGPGDGVQEEGCLDRCFQHGLGSSVRWQTDFWPLVESRGRATHQLPGNAGSVSGPSDLLVGPKGTPCSGPLGQHDCGVLHKSPERTLLEAPLHSGRASLGMGSAHLAFAETNACTEQIEPWSRHVAMEQCALRGVNAPFVDVSENLGHLWQGRGPPLHLRRQLSLPNLLFEGHDWPNLLLYAFPPIALIPLVIRPVREQEHKVLLVAPLWRNQHWFSELSQLLVAAPWPIPLRQDLLSQANRTMWHLQPELWALHLWPLDGSQQTSPGVS